MFAQQFSKTSESDVINSKHGSFSHNAAAAAADASSVAAVVAASVAAAVAATVASLQKTNSAPAAALATTNSNVDNG